jgi:hypothetical protein
LQDIRSLLLPVILRYRIDEDVCIEEGFHRSFASSRSNR